MSDLKEKIAVVTGASRGAGRGIAIELGAAGATVYVTGRSLRRGSTTYGLPETIEETAEMITVGGGQGIAVACDHASDSDIEWLFERVKRNHGRVDILVNNAWGGYENYISNDSFDAPFWEQPLARFDKMISVGLRSHLVTTRLALPLMLPHNQGLIINTTTHVQSQVWNMAALRPDFSLFYDTVKTAINRLSLGTAFDLRRGGYDIAVIALAPGWMRTENVLRSFDTDEANWQSVPALSDSETPRYAGRAVVALATDSGRLQKTGLMLTSGELAREYGFTDLDGRQPHYYESR